MNRIHVTGAGGLKRGAGTMVVGLLLVAAMLVAAPLAHAQDFVVTALVLVNTQNPDGYSTNPLTPGDFQRFAERYLEHLQIPYQVIDVATQAPPADTSSRQLIISAHRGLNPGPAWQTAISNAVAGGVGFVNLDSDTAIGSQAHIRTIFGASGASAGAPGTTIRIPQAVVTGGSTPHFIAALQRRFRDDPAGDIVYRFHPDPATAVPVRSTVLTGATGTVIAAVGTDPLVLARSSGPGRAVHFGTLDYLRADRFGFLMGVDDLFWRSLVWAARKPFVVRGYPRLWAIQMDDTLSGWGARVRDLYDVSLTGPLAADGTGGPWRVTGFVFTNNVGPGSADRASVIQDITAGRLQISPHARGLSYGDIYWETQAAQRHDDASWLQTVNDVQAWARGNGGPDTIPSLSRSMVPHFWNLNDMAGFDMWNTLGFRYVTEIQRPGIDFYAKSDPDRLRLRPFRLYELPPFDNPDENYPIYLADNYTVNSRTGLASQSFFAFTTQVIDLTRYDRQDLAWPSSTRPIEETIDQFEYYTWRLWSGLAPVQIYTHDGASNYVLATPAQRQQVIRDVSAWLNAERVRHVFMEDLGDYMIARARSVLTGAQVTGGDLTLTFSGNATTADGEPIETEVLVFQGDTEGSPRTIAGFTGGVTVTLTASGANPAPTTSGLTPSSAAAGSSAFTLTVTGANFVAGSVVRWNGADRSTTYVSPTQVRAAIAAADVASAGTAQVTVFSPAPGGGASNAQTFTITASSNPVPTTTGLNPSSAPAGAAGFTLTVSGTGFVGSSVVRWNGTNRPTTYVSATQLAAAIAAADVAAAGTAQVTVFTSTPGGGTSNAQAFTITAPSNPAPTTTGLSPASATAGGPGFTLTVTGSGFVASSVVQWNGANRATTFVSATQLQTAIGAADIAATGTATVTVVTPAPGGGTSNAQPFSILLVTSGFFDDFNRADAPELGNGWVEKSAGAFALVGNRVSKSATGTGYADNLVYRPASENLLDVEASVEVRFASMPPGYAQVFVRGQTPTIANAGTFSGYLLFTDNDPGRAFLDRIENGGFTPLAQLVISSGLNTTDTFRLRLRATGTNPVILDAFVERFTGSGWTLIGQATVNDTAPTRFATAGTVGFTGYIEGGVYTYDNFARTNLATGTPAPVVTGLAPVSVLAGAPGLTLTVTGSGFVSGSVVRWNGADRPTTFVSATQLRATISATDLGVTGTAQVAVFNPAADGGLGNAQYFSILDPSGTFLDTFNRADSVELGNGWTEKYPAAFSIQNNEVVMINTGDIDYHDAIAYRPVGEDLRDVEVGLEFRILATTLTFPQVHARIQRDTIAQADTLDDYLLFVDGFAPSPGRAVIARQAPVAGQFECYMLGIPFPSELSPSERYRVRLRVVGANPVTLTGFVDRFDGTAWQVFATGSIVHDASTQPIPGDYCAPGFMPPPITTAGAVGFAKWQTNNEVLDNFSWANAAVPNPVPTVSGMTPAVATSGGPGFTLTLTGTNFMSSSVVRWNGAARPTTFVSATQLTAAIPATDIAAVGTAQVTVDNPAPGGGTSNAQTFTIGNLVPTLNGLSPTSTVAGGPAFTLTVTGTNFISGSAVRWNDAARPTTYVSSTQLTAAIPATDIAAAATAQLTVFNPTPGGGTSAARTFSITNPVPALSGLDPSVAMAGAPAFTLTVTGSNFIASSVVRWNGAVRTTTYVSSTQLRATISAADIAVAGTAAITVVTPAPGGGTSNVQSLPILNPVPTISSVSPGSVVVGSGGFTLTVDGTNFIGTSVVRWNGADRPTTYVSATRLTVQISATDVLVAGTARVTVFNPAPGGGTSNSMSVVIGVLGGLGGI